MRLNSSIEAVFPGGCIYNLQHRLIAFRVIVSCMAYYCSLISLIVLHLSSSYPARIISLKCSSGMRFTSLEILEYLRIGTSSLMHTVFRPTQVHKNGPWACSTSLPRDEEPTKPLLALSPCVGIPFPGCPFVFA